MNLQQTAPSSGGEPRSKLKNTKNTNKKALIINQNRVKNKGFIIVKVILIVKVIVTSI